MTTKERTENLLKFVPETRSDDKLLCVLFMQKSGVNLSDAQIQAFYDMDDLWNVRRYRQKFQEHGQYSPTDQVREGRYSKFKKTRVAINSPTPEEALEKLGYRKVSEEEEDNYHNLRKAGLLP